VRSLGITEEQQQHLQQIVDATSQLITDVEDQLNGAISPEQYQKLLSFARNNALQSLTDQQRAKWQKISGEKPQNKSVPAAKDDK
jgi:small-conductance mechanosensitive channel